MRNLQDIPRVRDAWTFVYAERVRIEREEHAIVLWDGEGRIQVPCACVSAVLLGPGTSISHAAVHVLAEASCSVVWCGEGAVRLYASGLGGTRSASNLEHQARVWSDPGERISVVQRLYRMRFIEDLDEGLTLEQVRGKEGVRVREAYARASRETGIPWSGRSYRRDDWKSADPVNRALSTANACLYGVCHAAIVATGFTPGLGFIHTGKLLSFVYDVADLYKCEVTVPIAFRAVRVGTANLEASVRRACRNAFYKARLLERIVPDIQRALGLRPEEARLYGHTHETEEDEGVGALWDPAQGAVPGGRNFSEPHEGGEQ